MQESSFIDSMTSQERSYHLSVQGMEGHELSLELSGGLDVHNADKALRELRSLALFHKPREVKLDLSGVSYLDSSGAAALLEARLDLEARGMTLRWENLSPEVGGFLELLDLDSLARPGGGERVRPPDPISRLGDKALSLGRDMIFQISFLGELVLSLGQSLKHPGKVRWSHMLVTMERMGVEALPIVCLINFLIGLTIGFQSAVSLRQFGANIYLADLVGLGMVRELGPLMTAILVAGRSGSAFTAEIGTMKISEEIDALVTMGFDPTRFLVVPKLLAALVVVPCLTLFADLLGITGGMVVGVAWLDLTVSAYVDETYKVLSLAHVFSGVFKSVFFGLAVAVVGCLRGFQVQGGAEGVGKQTTSSVVTGILLIIVLDALFGILFQAWDI